MFYGQRHPKLDEALLIIVHAVLLQPDNLYYRLNAANVLTQQHNYASALGVLKLALTVAKTQAQEEMVQSRIDQLQRYQAAAERAKTQPSQPGNQSGTQPANQSSAPLNSINDPTKTVVFR